jgi:hypothetical protein
LVTVSLLNGSGGSLTIGQVVYYEIGTGLFAAVASSSLEKNNFPVGLMTATCANNATGSVAVWGQLTLTAAQWEAVTSNGASLTPGAWYYVDTVSGELLIGPPSASDYTAPVGIALTSTTLMILLGPPVLD